MNLRGAPLVRLSLGVQSRLVPHRCTAAACANPDATLAFFTAACLSGFVRNDLVRVPIPARCEISRFFSQNSVLTNDVHAAGAA